MRLWAESSSAVGTYAATGSFWRSNLGSTRVLTGNFGVNFELFKAMPEKSWAVRNDSSFSGDVHVSVGLKLKNSGNSSLGDFKALKEPGVCT